MITATRFSGRTGLDNTALMKSAPSIFADSPWGGMSNRYRMVPTIQVVDMLRERNFLPVMASQSKSRIEGKGDFTKHMIRFRSGDLIGPLERGHEIPELVLVNSHDGTAAYKFMSGIFRLVCGNGMIVQTANFGGVNVRHNGGIDFQRKVIDATFEVMSVAPLTLNSIEEWKGIEVSQPKRLAFAKAALELIPAKTIEAPQLLKARRSEDMRTDLWTTMNVVQENLMQGGVQGHTPSGRRTTTRPVKSVTEDLRINRALWRLTEEMAKLS